MRRTLAISTVLLFGCEPDPSFPALPSGLPDAPVIYSTFGAKTELVVFESPSSIAREIELSGNDRLVIELAPLGSNALSLGLHTSDPDGVPLELPESVFRAVLTREGGEWVEAAPSEVLREFRVPFEDPCADALETHIALPDVSSVRGLISNGEQVLAANREGFFLVDRQGATRVPHEPPELTFELYTAVATSTGGFYLSNPSGIWRARIENGRVIAGFDRPLQDPDDPLLGHLVEGQPGELFALTREGGLYRSPGVGQAWTRLGALTPPANLDERAMGLARTDDGVVAVSGGDSELLVYSETDGVRRQTGPSDSALQSVIFDPSLPGFVVAATTGALYVQRAGWTELPRARPLAIDTLALAAPGQYLGAGRAFLERTGDFDCRVAPAVVGQISHVLPFDDGYWLGGSRAVRSEVTTVSYVEFPD